MTDSSFWPQVLLSGLTSDLQPDSELSLVDMVEMESEGEGQWVEWGVHLKNAVPKAEQIHFQNVTCGLIRDFTSSKN